MPNGESKLLNIIKLMKYISFFPADWRPKGHKFKASYGEVEARLDSFLRIQNKHTESTGVVLPRDSRMGPCVQTPIPNIDK